MLTDCLGLNCKKCVKLQKKKISSLDRLSCNYKLNSREMFFYCDKNRNLSLQSIMKKLMKTHIKVQKCKLSVTFTKAVGRTGVFAASPGPYVWHLWSKGWRWCKARIHIQQAGLPTRIRISSNKRWALFFIGCQAGLFFLPVLQCNWASLWLLHQTASALSRGFTHTSQEKWEPDTPLWCLLVMDTKQQVWHSQTVRKFQIIWQLFLLATPWMCSAKKQKMSAVFLVARLFLAFSARIVERVRAAGFPALPTICWILTEESNPWTIKSVFTNKRHLFSDTLLKNAKETFVFRWMRTWAQQHPEKKRGDAPQSPRSATTAAVAVSAGSSDPGQKQDRQDAVLPGHAGGEVGGDFWTALGGSNERFPSRSAAGAAGQT